MKKLKIKKKEFGIYKYNVRPNFLKIINDRSPFSDVMFDHTYLYKQKEREMHTFLSL